MRLRDVGLAIGRGTPGPHNAVTDVPGVRVGHVTLIDGDGPRTRGHGPVRTGVTVVLPHGGQVWHEPVHAGAHVLNGCGEVTGLAWLRESGRLMTPIALTNTHSVGVVRDALVALEAEQRPDDRWFALPVVGETFDGLLNDINGFHVRPEHVRAAVEAASDGPVAEGNVGGGTGMICHQFKGGIGTSSRVTDAGGRRWTVGVLVQANYGRRDRLRIAGVPVGELVPPSVVPVPGWRVDGAAPVTPEGSIIVVVATDAPVLPHQCDRLAQRAGLGVGRVGGLAENTSGDLFLAFSTANRGRVHGDFDPTAPTVEALPALADTALGPLFEGVVDATEEAICNALVAAETMTGCDGITAHALGAERLAELASHTSPSLRT